MEAHYLHGQNTEIIMTETLLKMLAKMHMVCYPNISVLVGLYDYFGTIL